MLRTHEYPPTAVAPATATVTPKGHESFRRRERVLSDKFAFSSRISPAQSKALAELVRETGKPQTRLVEEALAMRLKHYGKG